MKKVIASKDFTVNGKFYFKDQELEGFNIDQIVKLNEQGFIQPLNQKELIQIENELNEPKKKKEEEKDGSTL